MTYTKAHIQTQTMHQRKAAGQFVCVCTMCQHDMWTKSSGGVRVRRLDPK